MRGERKFNRINPGVRAFELLLILVLGLTQFACSSSSGGGAAGGGGGGSSGGGGSESCETSSLSFDGIDSVSNVTGTSAQLNWTHAAGARVYFIYDMSSGSPVMVTHVSAPATSYVVNGLSTTTSYTYRVRAIDGDSLFDSNTNDISFATMAMVNRLLDDVTGASVAFSVRKLRAAYTGAAVRVRRDSDHLEADIGFDGNGDLDEAALTAHLAGANGYVVTWYDQIGNAHASQSTVGQQPRIRLSATPNGRPSIEFDGANDFLNNASVSYTARTVFAAWRMSSALQSTSKLAQLWGHYAGHAHVAPDARSIGTISYDGGSPTSTTARYGLNQAAYSGYGANPAGTGWMMNSWYLLASEFNADQAMGQHTIGSLYPDFAVGQHEFGGDLTEVIVFGGVVNDADRASVETSQSTYFY